MRNKIKEKTIGITQHIFPVMIFLLAVSLTIWLFFFSPIAKLKDAADEQCQLLDYKKHTDYKLSSGLSNRVKLECDKKVLNKYCEAVRETDKWGEPNAIPTKIICYD